MGNHVLFAHHHTVSGLHSKDQFNSPFIKTPIGPSKPVMTTADLLQLQVSAETMFIAKTIIILRRGLKYHRESNNNALILGH